MTRSNLVSGLSSGWANCSASAGSCSRSFSAIASYCSAGWPASSIRSPQRLVEHGLDPGQPGAQVLSPGDLCAGMKMLL
ncbi:MAG: hypothetical protein PHQ40_15340 [Anaerolineaceae bacterium]|nr:hypothetical protein [Anaerolineaceae bacterium]